MSTIKAIHASARTIGLDEDTRRDLYHRVTGKRTLTKMSPSEQFAVLKELRAQGANSASPHTGRKKLTGPYAGKLQALWISGWNLGLVRNRDDQAMLAFITRQTGIQHTAFLRDAADARKAVEGLKAWLVRDGKVDWGEFDDPRDCVFAAQLRLLAEVPALRVTDGWTAILDDLEMQASMNEMGRRIRERGAKPALRKTA